MNQFLGRLATTANLLTLTGVASAGTATAAPPGHARCNRQEPTHGPRALARQHAIGDGPCEHRPRSCTAKSCRWSATNGKRLTDLRLTDEHFVAGLRIACSLISLSVSASSSGTPA